MVKQSSVDRREYLSWLGIAGAVGLAGCSGDEGIEEEGGEDDDSILTVVERTSPDTINPIMTAAAEEPLQHAGRTQR